LFGVGGARDVDRRNVSAHDFQHGRLDVVVGDALDVPVSALLVPNLKRLTSDAV
jgi:hypothetical protein